MPDVSPINARTTSLPACRATALLRGTAGSGGTQDPRGLWRGISSSSARWPRPARTCSPRPPAPSSRSCRTRSHPRNRRRFARCWKPSWAAVVDTIFAEFDWEPLAGGLDRAGVPGASSRAVSDVVVKVQRPGIADAVARDLSVLDELARLIEDRTTWGRSTASASWPASSPNASPMSSTSGSRQRAAKEIARALPLESRVRIPASSTPASPPRGFSSLERFDGAAALRRRMALRPRAQGTRRRAVAGWSCTRCSSTGSSTPTRTRATSCCCKAATSGSSTSAARAGSTRCSRPGCATCSSRSAPAAPRRCGRRCSRWRSPRGRRRRLDQAGTGPFRRQVPVPRRHAQRGHAQRPAPAVLHLRADARAGDGHLLPGAHHARGHSACHRSGIPRDRGGADHGGRIGAGPRSGAGGPAGDRARRVAQGVAHAAPAARTGWTGCSARASGGCCGCG